MEKKAIQLMYIITVIYNDLCYSDVCVFNCNNCNQIHSMFKINNFTNPTGVFKNNKYRYIL